MACKEKHGHHRQHHRHHECGGGEPCDCQTGEREGSGRCQCQDHRGKCDCSSFTRRYQTKAEHIAELEEYLAQLKAEVQAVEERLADVRG